jgi:hypothetical protein
MKSRRALLRAAAAAPALPILGQQAGGALTVDELKVAAQLADHIIPRTETPGASDAGAHTLIDRALAANPDRLHQFKAGLAKFSGLDGAAQLAELRAMSRRRDPFFKLLKDLTIDAYYSTREGLERELGWKGLTPIHEFKGCTHPEHQG